LLAEVKLRFFRPDSSLAQSGCGRVGDKLDIGPGELG
jgi:hypothetical protein